MATETKPRTVTWVEQEAMGLVGTRYTPARIDGQPARAEVIHKDAAAMQHSSQVIDVPVTAVQQVTMHTSAVDRAKGFLISTVGLFAAFSFAVAVAAIVLAGVQLAIAFVIYWLVFAITWLAAYIWTLLISAEGVSLYEAKRKWDVVAAEQRARWEYYREVSK